VFLGEELMGVEKMHCAHPMCVCVCVGDTHKRVNYIKVAIC